MQFIQQPAMAVLLPYVVVPLVIAIKFYLRVRKAKGPRERAFALRMAGLFAPLALGFFLWKLLAPPPYKYLVAPVYLAAVIGGRVFWSRRQKAIRAEEEAEIAGDE